MAVIRSITIEASDPAAADAFYDRAFGLGDTIRTRAANTETTGFRGCALSLVVSQPGTVDSLIETAVHAGATTLKPTKKSFWGYGGVVQAPDGTIWKVATSAKKHTGPVTRDVDDIVLLLGVNDVKATKEFYVNHGLTVAKSFGRKYVEFDGSSSAAKLALYGRKAAAKDVGVDPDGSGSHRVVIGTDSEAFTDPDGFAWEPASA